MWSRCTWMGYRTFGGQLFFLDPSKIDCRHRRRLYQYSYVFFLLCFCVFPLIDATRMHLTNISFFPFKYLYTWHVRLSSPFPFFLPPTLLHVPLFEIRIIYGKCIYMNILKSKVYKQPSSSVTMTGDLKFCIIY